MQRCAIDREGDRGDGRGKEEDPLFDWQINKGPKWIDHLLVG
jgi:hypothetical protein